MKRARVLAALALVLAGCIEPESRSPYESLLAVPADRDMREAPLADRLPGGREDAERRRRSASPSASNSPLAKGIPDRAKGSIVAGGRAFGIDAPVIHWFDPGGFDAYAGGNPERPGPARSLHYEPGRPGLGRQLEKVRERVDLFVLHYDAVGLSSTCASALNNRGLSVHFMVDLDGTIYQALDVVDTAWHARHANSRSVGVEIAHIGAYPPGPSPLDDWYVRGKDGLQLDLRPGSVREQLSNPRYRTGPARPSKVSGRIHGRYLEQPDFTPEQYASLAALTRGLLEIFPRLRADYPRDRSGRLRRDVLSRREFDNFRGLLGHWHVTEDKIDPGPAFDWDRLVRESLQPR